MLEVGRASPQLVFAKANPDTNALEISEYLSK